MRMYRADAPVSTLTPSSDGHFASDETFDDAAAVEAHAVFVAVDAHRDNDARYRSTCCVASNTAIGLRHSSET